MDSNPKTYELAYLLSPSIREEEILTHAAKITGVIEQAGGLVKHAETPRKRRLAYPVKKQTNAYFGWTIFSALPEAIKAIEKQIKAESPLRSMLVEEEPMPEPRRMPVPGRRPAGVGRVMRTPEKPEEKLDLEALDKKLEEILGK